MEGSRDLRWAAYFDFVRLLSKVIGHSFQL